MNIDDLIAALQKKENQPCYPERIKSLKSRGRSTDIIEKGISQTLDVLSSGVRSFVVYGEPQSGKTEFMIALVCKLIDIGKQTIFVVMNDNTELENQNFDRFHAATELNPTPIRDYELKSLSLSELKTSRQRIIFCRKNSKNLQKLIEFTRFMGDSVVIDDEADYASPNARINKYEVTAINKHLGKLGDLGDNGEGIYIGVTATPARLDLNNTFANDASKWVFLESHSNYRGRSFFFPMTEDEAINLSYNLVKLPDDTDDPRLLRHAVFRFLLRVAILNNHPESDTTAYSMLIHTAGTTNDHERDQKDIQSIINILSSKCHKKFKQYAQELFLISQRLCEQTQIDFLPQELWEFVMRNIGKNDVLIINHKADSANVKRAGQPKALFTFAIGGNIVSRGLTFENLLTFFFSRNVKNKLQQNTYIQRARMFGYRPYHKYFELCVPQTLFENWASCFQDHEVSLRMAKAGHYIHVFGKKTQVVDAGAIDKKNVSMETSEREIGSIFELTPALENAFKNHDGDKTLTLFEKLLSEGILESDAFTPSLLVYLREVCKKDESDVFLVTKTVNESNEIQNIEQYKDGDSENITRVRGGIIHAMLNRRPEYERHNHFILPIKNARGEARLLYKPKINRSILQNISNQKAITT